MTRVEALVRSGKVSRAAAEEAERALEDGRITPAGFESYAIRAENARIRFAGESVRDLISSGLLPEETKLGGDARLRWG